MLSIWMSFVLCAYLSQAELYPDCIFLGCSCTRDTIRCPHDGFLTMFPKRRIGKTYIHNMVIDISGNGLQMVPDDRFAELNVLKIDLSHNSIYKLSADTFRDILRLNELDLSSNKLRYLNPNTFIPIENSLETLVLSDNYLTQMESIRLTNLAKKLYRLKKLDLDKNRLIYVPNFVDTNLTRLSLAENYVESLLDSETYKNLLPSSLVELRLEKNRLKQLNDNSFQNLVNLKYLNLESNEISAIAESSFLNLKSLLVLNLKQNSLKHIPSRIFFTLENLDLVDLSSQRQEIKVLNNYAFDRYSNRKPIKKVLLNNNSIERIESRAFCSKLAKRPYANLKEIDLSSNFVQSVSECILRQLFKGFTEPMMPRHKVMTKVILNEEKDSFLMKCGCEISRASKLVELSGMCTADDGTVSHLSQYDCGGYSTNSVDFVHRLCKAQKEFECLSSNFLTTPSYMSGLFWSRTFPFNSSFENFTYNGDLVYELETKADLSISNN
ncbi:insulin-like growth factor-binding complex acid labile subunit [Brachionus plicatilis]|uniref:Insulin-like growth factor-binding complex acid labile subunit n=1 Tax=Brachionus plicatilis TaxID=10195 RepID=A0A3M7QFZ1_BRAPC|nr:insulin-like growth factor-binding complex acid labile subunit [Brachionus plicatilis]